MTVCPHCNLTYTSNPEAEHLCIGTILAEKEGIVCEHCEIYYIPNSAYTHKCPETIIPPKDNINHPAHYTSSDAKCSQCGHTIECIEITRSLPFNIGNAIKYLWRYNLKNGLEDLKKARWYLNDAISQLEKNND